jgi:hypothetical protein
MQFANIACILINCSTSLFRSAKANVKESFDFYQQMLFLLTFSRLMTYIYMSYRTANLQTLHFIYLFNKYMY